MQKIWIFFLIMIYSSFLLAADWQPLNDNILFAFDHCRTVSVDLNKPALQEESSKSFDMHCKVSNTDQRLFKCDYFDTGSSKRGDLEILEGGRNKQLGHLSSKGGTIIRFYFSKGSASYEAIAKSKDGLSDGRKVCAGIFILEQEALKKKK